jgi:hypothetical protein
MGDATTTTNAAPTPPAPEASPDHPQHHMWLARAVNGLLGAGIFVISGGRVRISLGDDSASSDANL